jgi:trehalose 6-phosphate phosphatase
MGAQRPGPSNEFAMDLPRILDRRREVKARLDCATGLLLFLDFDGTLAPIVAEPALAELPGPTRRVLYELAALPAITISIVSGRALRDVKRRLGIPGVIYAGNHGLEIEGRGLVFEHSGAVEIYPAVNKITSMMLARSNDFKGVEVEAKGLTTSLHYRQASRPIQLALGTLLRNLIPPDDPRIEIREGKMVYEVLPRVAWDKGHAVVWIRDQVAQAGALPIVIGDDMTDENAFTAFDDAMTICVDPRRATAAIYRLESPDDVKCFLGWLVSVWKNGRR